MRAVAGPGSPVLVESPSYPRALAAARAAGLWRCRYRSTPTVCGPTCGGMVEFLLAVHTGAHPASQWLADPVLRWAMESDWLRNGPGIPAGPS